MRKKGIVFSDVDGTLCFHQEAHNIREIEKFADGTVVAEDPITHKTHHAYDVSISSYNNIYMALETRQLGHKVRENYDFVYVTGGRPSTIFSRTRYFDFADAVILESGGMILDNHLEQDESWTKKLEPEKETLSGVAESLMRMGWNLDVAGRTSALRVRRRDNPNKSSADFDTLCREISLPDTLKKTMNLDNLDIILQSAGKANAVRYWMEAKGYPVSKSIGIGDDINDIDFLAITGRKYVLASSVPDTIQAARENGWSISVHGYFDGINEILENILRL